MDNDREIVKNGLNQFIARTKKNDEIDLTKLFENENDFLEILEKVSNCDSVKNKDEEEFIDIFFRKEFKFILGRSTGKEEIPLISHNLISIIINLELLMMQNKVRHARKLMLQGVLAGYIVLMVKEKYFKN